MEDEQKPTQKGIEEEKRNYKTVSIDDPSKFDYSNDYYKSEQYFEQEYPDFPSEYYTIMSLHAKGMTPKQCKNLLKKQEKKQMKKKGKKTKNV